MQWRCNYLLLIVALTGLAPSSSWALGKSRPEVVDCAERLIPQVTAEDLAQTKLRLQTAIAAGPVSIDPLIKPAEYIRSVGSQLKNNNGAVNNGVFRVETQDGPAVLKLSYETLAKNWDGYLIHHELGKLGMAPQLNGIIHGNELALLFKKFRKLRIRRHSTMPSPEDLVGIVMQEIPGGWNSKDKPHLVGGRPYTGNWNYESLEQQLAVITSSLDRLEIVSVDEQFLVSRDGKVYLIDFGEYSQLPKAYAGPIVRQFQEQLDNVLKLIQLNRI